MSSPFSIRAGTSQLRCIPTNWVAREGSYVLVLGDDLPNQFETLSTGDYIYVQQEKDPTDPDGATLLTFSLRIRPPKEVPAGCKWVFSYMLDGVTWEKEIKAAGDYTQGMTRDYTESGFKILNSGDQILAFFLSFVATGGPIGPVDAELPGVYVDAVVLNFTSTSVVVLNRDPEPGFIQVDPEGPIILDIADGPLGGLDHNSIKVIINGEDAYKNGGHDSGFTGDDSIFNSGYFQHLTIIPPAPWTSKQLITVQVQASAGASLPLDTTYTFVVTDSEAPLISTVRSSGLKTVEVTFSEAVKNEDGSTSTDALNPANYSFARVVTGNVPQVDVVAISVEKISETVFQVTTDIELTPLGNYVVLVDHVADIWGNGIGEPLQASFVASALPKTVLRNLNLYKMLGNIHRRRDRTGDLEKFLACMQEVLSLVLYDSDRFLDNIDPDYCDAKYLDALLFKMGNPFQFELTETLKRRLIGVLVDIYRNKGIKTGIISTVNFLLGLTIDIKGIIEGTWFLGDAELGVDTILSSSDTAEVYSFDVISPIFLTDAQKQNITSIVEYMKPAHTHMRKPIVEPDVVVSAYDPVELGISHLNEDFILH